MPYILELGIQEIYQERGWDLVMNTNRYGEDDDRRFPTLSDLVERVQIITDRIGYAGEILSNIKAALVARLNQLRFGGGKGPMFNTHRSVSLEDIFSSPCIFELKQVVTDDEKAFFIGLLLINLYEYHEIRSSQGKITAGNPLHHVTLIEEAHRLLRNTSTEQNGETANPQGRAIEVFTNILAEIRAYGEGILIAEQLPVKLTPDAIKNTNLKIVHRLVSNDDREIIGATLNLDETQKRYLTRLERGSAIIYAEGLQKSVQVSIPPANYKDSGQKIAAIEIKEVMNDRFWNQAENINLKIPFSECSHCPNSKLQGRSCGSREASYADRILLDSFHKLFNTLRFTTDDFTKIVHAYDEFAKSCQNHQARRQQSTSLYCLFVELVNIETEQRGRLGQWKYDDINRVIQLASIILYRLSIDRGNIEPSSLKNWREIRDLSNLLNQLNSNQNLLPYPGCIECLNPCHYRYDIEMLTASDSIISIVEKRISQENSDKPDRERLISILFEEYKLAAQQLFPESQNLNAVLCLAVQDTGKNNLTTNKQMLIVKSIKNYCTIDKSTKAN